MIKTIKKKLFRFLDKDNQAYIFQKKRLWKIIMIFSIVLFLLILLAAGFYAKEFFVNKTEFSQPQELPVDNVGEKDVSDNCPNCIRRKIDGLYVLPEESDLPLFSVMLDNHFDARPIYGIEKASLVYEAEVEGRFTRYMAIFSSQEDIEEIGPVRSARPYFVDWVGELDALYVHVGGSPQALADILAKKVFDLNEFYNEHSFWRTNKKIAPHNVLTSSELLNKYLDKYENVSSDFESWQFKDDEPSQGILDAEIIINFKPVDFRVSWIYNRENNDYLRISDYDRGAAEIKAKNIIIQYLPAVVLDEKLRLGMEAVRQGESTICLDGVCSDGYWVKESVKARTRFFSEDGTEIKFNAGTSWIEVLRPDIDVIINKQA